MSIRISKSGLLHIVSTPIGNLSDITQRARQTLDSVDLIAAEDTRHSAKLLSNLGISTPLIALHEHNESSVAQLLIKKLKKGENIALISDAGTPLISDPGFKLVDLAYKNDIGVTPIPGPSSITAALSVAGIDTSSYTFVGFLPAKANQRRQALNNLKQKTETLVVFESPHRIKNCIEDFLDIFGQDRMVAYCRELTKQFETVKRAKLIEIYQFIEHDANQTRGEIVLVISGAAKQDVSHVSQEFDHLLKDMIQYMPVKKAAALLAKHSRMSKNYYYKLALEQKNKLK